MDFDPRLIPGFEKTGLPKGDSLLVAIAADLGADRLPSGIRPVNIHIAAGYFNRVGIDVAFTAEALYDGPPADPAVDFNDRPAPYHASFDRSVAAVSRALQQGGDLRVLTSTATSDRPIGTLGIMSYQLRDRIRGDTVQLARVANPPESIVMPNAPEAAKVLEALARLAVPDEHDAAWLVQQLTPPVLPERPS